MTPSPVPEAPLGDPGRESGEASSRIRDQYRFTLGPVEAVGVLDPVEDVVEVVACPAVFEPVGVSAETDPHATAPKSNAAAMATKRIRELMALSFCKCPYSGPIAQSVDGVPRYVRFVTGQALDQIVDERARPPVARPSMRAARLVRRVLRRTVKPGEVGDEFVADTRKRWMA